MSNWSNIIYVYDGSYEGLLCCVFESFEKKERPFDIQLDDAPQLSFYPIREIDTDLEKAQRVKNGIRRNISKEAYDLIELGYHTCQPHKEQMILAFVHTGMKYGKRTLSLLTNDSVCSLQKAVQHLTGEAHQLKGFVRFSQYDKILVSVIEPQNFVLPLLAPHFCDRYANEAFLIYDKTHGFMLVYKPYQYTILPVEDFIVPDAGAEEQYFRSLWKTFYNTIAIEDRYNPRCRMSHMQKRYWKHLTEMDPRVPARIEERRKQQLIQPIALENNTKPEISSDTIEL